MSTRSRRQVRRLHLNTRYVDQPEVHNAMVRSRKERRALNRQRSAAMLATVNAVRSVAIPLSAALLLPPVVWFAQQMQESMNRMEAASAQAAAAMESLAARAREIPWGPGTHPEDIYEHLMADMDDEPVTLGFEGATRDGVTIIQRHPNGTLTIIDETHRTPEPPTPWYLVDPPETETTTALAADTDPSPTHPQEETK